MTSADIARHRLGIGPPIVTGPKDPIIAPARRTLFIGSRSLTRCRLLTFTGECGDDP